MRKLIKAALDILTPGAPHFKEKMEECEKREKILRGHLQMLEQPASSEIKQATDEASEFMVNVSNSFSR